LKEKIFKNTYIDKVSDLVIEPANTYIYHRLSSEMVKEVLENIEPNLIKDVKNQVGKTIDLWDI
jgi:hypothetical protein